MASAMSSSTKDKSWYNQMAAYATTQLASSVQLAVSQ